MKTVVTYSGNFHVDELFALATLKLALQEPIEVVRTRDREVIMKSDIAIDVGGVYVPESGRFDHHQEGGAGKRENGIFYSSFSLVWKTYGSIAIENLSKEYEVVLSGSSVQEIWNSIDSRIGAPIDAHDVGMETVQPVFDGVYPYLAHNVFSSFRPGWFEKKSFDEAFGEALHVAVKTLRGEITYLIAEKKAEEEVLRAYEGSVDKRIVVLEEKYPWEGILARVQEVLFVVTPDHTPPLWKATAVRNDMHNFKNRKDFPKSWAGKTNEELQKITGVPDATFCHNARFVALARSKEGALALAKLAVESSE